MPRQLALWPETEKPSHPGDIWEELDPERKATIIAILARLIRRAAHPKNQEKTHERE